MPEKNRLGIAGKLKKAISKPMLLAAAMAAFGGSADAKGWKRLLNTASMEARQYPDFREAVQ